MRRRFVVLGILLTGTAFGGWMRRPPRTPPSAGEIRMVIDGGSFHSEAFTLPQTDGDWFATPTDAHASLTFAGSRNGNPITLSLQWDGPQQTHVINVDNRADSFFLTMSGKAPYDLAAQPRNDDAATVSVTKIDNLDLQATISGTVTRSQYDDDAHRYPVYAITGTIALHRSAAPTRTTTGTYGACDNVVHDKLIGAESRSPSECEVRFDLDVRQALRDALEKVATAFSASQWLTEPRDPVTPPTALRRGSEKAFFQVREPLSLKMDPASDDYQAYRRRFEALQEKASEEIRTTGAPGPSNAALRKLGDEINDATKIDVIVSINQTSGGFVSYTVDHRVLVVPGAAYGVAASRVQAPTGGGIDASLGNVSYVFLGRWKPAVFEKLGDGGEQAQIASVMNAADPHLSVQNIIIRIEGSPALTEKVLKHIDMAALQKLLPR